MHLNTIALIASTLALTSAAPTNSGPSTTGNTNIDYCASKGGLINALNCVKLLNNLNIDLDILKKREAEAEPEPLLGLGGSAPESNKPAASQTNIEYCSSQGLLNLANCLDILNDVNVDVSVLDLGDLGLKEKRNWDDEEWDDNGDDTPAPVTSTTTTRAQPSPTPTPTKPAKYEKPPTGGPWTDYGLTEENVKVCKSKGLVNALNCLSILNNLNLSVGILNGL